MKKRIINALKIETLDFLKRITVDFVMLKECLGDTR